MKTTDICATAGFSLDPEGFLASHFLLRLCLFLFPLVGFFLEVFALLSRDAELSGIISETVSDLVMSPGVPTVGKGILAIADNMVQCIGSATEPAFGVFHHTPLLQLSLEGNWSYIDLIAKVSRSGDIFHTLFQVRDCCTTSSHVVRLQCSACCSALVTQSCSTFRLFSWLAALTDELSWDHFGR